MSCFVDLIYKVYFKTVYVFPYIASVYEVNIIHTPRYIQ